MTLNRALSKEIMEHCPELGDIYPQEGATMLETIKHLCSKIIGLFTENQQLIALYEREKVEREKLQTQCGDYLVVKATLEMQENEYKKLMKQYENKKQSKKLKRS